MEVTYSQIKSNTEINLLIEKRKSGPRRAGIYRTLKEACGQDCGDGSYDSQGAGLWKTQGGAGQNCRLYA